MNQETILKNTTSFDEELLDALKDPEVASEYLKAARESYNQDNDRESFLHALTDVAKAQGGLHSTDTENTIDLATVDKVLHNLGFNLLVEPQNRVS